MSRPLFVALKASVNRKCEMDEKQEGQVTTTVTVSADTSSYTLPLLLESEFEKTLKTDDHKTSVLL